MKEITRFIKEGLKITSKTKVDKYTYRPKTKEELQDLLKQLIEERGNEGNFNDIDISEITDMEELFKDMVEFNGNISNWDVSNVTNMEYMFDCSKSFNQDISNWDVSNVIHTNFMFDNCPIEEKYKPKFK